MVSLTFFFFVLVILFGIVGAARGWAKEMLVSFGVILALFLIALLEHFVPIIRSMASSTDPDQIEALFWLRFTIIVLLGFFGYQTPNLPRINSTRFARERLQDALLGFVLGALNAFLIVGSIWFYMDQAGYPFASITAPPANDVAYRLLSWMAPGWMVIPYIYFAVAIAFVFVIVVFL